MSPPGAPLALRRAAHTGGLWLGFCRLAAFSPMAWARPAAFLQSMFAQGRVRRSPPAWPAWVFVGCRKAVRRALLMRSLSALRNRFPNRFIEQFFLWRRPWKMRCN